MHLAGGRLNDRHGLARVIDKQLIPGTVDLPASGAVAPGGSGIIGVLADATLLADGHYHGTLTVNVYDINHQVGSQVVPVTFNPGFEAPVNCPYTPGDINGNHSVNGVDIVYAVNYLTGRGGPPPIDCFSYCQGTPNPFYAAGDVNGNCAFNGIDITFFVRYLKLQVPNLLYCPGCPPPPPALSAPPAPPVPAVMPKLAPRITIQKHQSGQ